MAKPNLHYAELKSSYLFYHIEQRTNAYRQAHPGVPLLRLGADKVSINSPAVRNPDFITESALRFGSQCIVLAMDVKSRAGGGWDVYVRGGR